MKRSEIDQKILVFSLFDQICGLSISKVEEILPLPEITTVPGMPSFFEGYFNLEGRATVVLNINGLLGLKTFSKDLHCSLVCIKGEASPISILVYRALSIVSITKDSIRGIPSSESFNSLVTGILEIQEGPVSILSFEHLLLEKEKQSLAEFSQMFQSRLEGLMST